MAPHWNTSSLALFDTVKGMNGLVQGLFAGAGLPEEQGYKAEVANLLASFRQLEGESQGLEKVLAREFSGNPALLSEKERAR